MGTAYSAHARHRQNWWCDGTRSQIDNTFAIWPWTGNTLWRALAYKQTVARTPHILFPRWSIPYRLRNKQERKTVNWFPTLTLLSCRSINNKRKKKQVLSFTVASLHWQHLTTCWSLLPEMSIIAWQTLQVTMGMPPWVADWYGGGSSSGPIGDTVLTVEWGSSEMSSSTHRQQRVQDLHTSLFLYYTLALSLSLIVSSSRSLSLSL